MSRRYFITPHAMRQFRDRVDPSATDDVIIRQVQADLRRRRVVLEPGRTKSERYYQGWHNGTVYYAMIGPGEGEWPAVVTIMGPGSVLSQKVYGNPRVVRRHGTATVARPPVRLPELAEVRERYFDKAYQASMTPLRIEIDMPRDLLSDQRWMVDGLIARCVLSEAGVAEAYAESGPLEIPLPLYCLWKCPDVGLPLWAANDFSASSDAESTVTRISGTAIGDLAEVARLVGGYFQEVGVGAGMRLRSIGTIEKFDLARPVPVAYFGLDAKISATEHVAWTPPYDVVVPEALAACGQWPLHKNGGSGSPNPPGRRCTNHGRWRWHENLHTNPQG